MDRGDWWATSMEVSKSQTWLSNWNNRQTKIDWVDLVTQNTRDSRGKGEWAEKTPGGRIYQAERMQCKDLEAEATWRGLGKQGPCGCSMWGRRAVTGLSSSEKRLTWGHGKCKVVGLAALLWKTALWRSASQTTACAHHPRCVFRVHPQVWLKLLLYFSR